ncbi:hypothetical protein KSP40_PGU000370 [Platanthera guangdongensis]|uniref:Terpene synthase N-terminal domain-containing protein n=1 Tax=Platanthera guangdongensis TaxID=2320717 RepID=A0ABR2LU18_9ASPA
MLRSMNDGEITSSAYDTAWVSMVPILAGDGGGGPQFPSSLRWIIDNQLDDGSWGHDNFFSAHDRIISTLACVVALSSWSVCPEQCKRGLIRIPMELMHRVPTSMLFSLEGMPGLEWKKLLRLQSIDGSFFFSPASTAFALMETGDENCRSYLSKLVERFHGGVPNVYPVDLFERLWAVDRLQRLGISHHFEAEIEVLMDYVLKLSISFFFSL